MDSTFRTSFAHNIFRNKYAKERNITWADLARMLVDDVCGTMGGTKEPLLSKGTLDQIEEDIREMRFIPGGRYLYYAGRKLHAWNNCLTGDHKLLTDKGMIRLDCLMDGQEIKVYSPVSKQFESATAKSHGKQPVQRITFENLRGRSEKSWSVKATRNHHWPLMGGKDTYDIRVGDVVPAAVVELPLNQNGWIHGAMFADGSQQIKGQKYYYQLRLCGKKAQHVDRFMDYSVTYPQFAGGDPVIYFNSEFNLKNVPKLDDFNYIASFIKGWVDFDGHNGETRKLHCVQKEAIEFFIENAHLAGFVVTGDMQVETKPSNFGPRQPLYHVNFKSAEEFSGFKVTSISPLGEENVYCPFEPKYNRIVIDHGIDTYQCFLLKGEEDTREEWGAVTKRASDCLMLGGGIGIDYSEFRPKGRPLSRTGGESSGPIPLMCSINEYGRNVMQGGSRRSAIYASLNWKHGDAHSFLRAKNWADMPIGKAKKKDGTQYTIADAKQDDFNFPAPLDMTNISLNYDNDFLNKISLGDSPETFVENVKQALQTGEPGFSFNFGLQEKETLRNACTEVTSEDDSDVCNLGSANMARITSAKQMFEVCERASMFLTCGTIRADLPYDKVRVVREKNRRLGLGLMGMHEWLLVRGYRYEVTEEMHTWLKQYELGSEYGANWLCDRLGISRPVAYRAIAPTGSIGILAATTTGMEPLFATAFKRRYLVEGTKWKYEYVVDATASFIINNYGVDPDKIETAASLAADPERRIKFQADVQDYVDMSISSTINMPAWGSDLNNEDKVKDFAKILAKYAPRLRGFTCYPDGARGGQPLVQVPYSEALKHRGVVFDEVDVCEWTGKGGTCGS